MSKRRTLSPLQLLVVLGLIIAAASAHCRMRNEHTPQDRAQNEGAELAYNSKAEPVAMIVAAEDMMYRKGWETIEKHFPWLGYPSDALKQVNPRDPSDHRFLAQFVTEDPGRSPIPLISIICSLDARQVAGPLRSLRESCWPPAICLTTTTGRCRSFGTRATFSLSRRPHSKGWGSGGRRQTSLISNLFSFTRSTWRSSRKRSGGRERSLALENRARPKTSLTCKIFTIGWRTNFRATSPPASALLA